MTPTTQTSSFGLASTATDKTHIRDAPARSAEDHDKANDAHVPFTIQPNKATDVPATHSKKKSHEPTKNKPDKMREKNESRAHGNDERISTQNLTTGTELLWQIVQSVTQ